MNHIYIYISNCLSINTIHRTVYRNLMNYVILSWSSPHPPATQLPRPLCVGALPTHHAAFGQKHRCSLGFRATNRFKAAADQDLQGFDGDVMMGICKKHETSVELWKNLGIFIEMIGIWYNMIEATWDVPAKECVDTAVKTTCLQPFCMEKKMIGLEVLGLLDFETNKDRIKVDVEAPTQGDTIWSNLVKTGVPVGPNNTTSSAVLTN